MSRVANANGKRSVVFNPSAGYADRPMLLPCGQCIGCRLERSRQWAARCVHEASLHEENCFITLTYNEAELPSDGSLSKRHFQLFMKRLRKKFGHGIRYFQCGEYGPVNHRPHYHACLFNFDFPDKKPWKERDGIVLHTSKVLEDLWSLGFCSTGALTYQSAAYVARYILKKVTGKNAPDHYEWTDAETGEIHQREPEYVSMSRRPGIARDWIATYREDVYPGDFVVIDTKKIKVPKYYDKIQEEENPGEYRKTRAKRIAGARKFAENNTPERLKTREKVQHARARLLPRKLD